MCSSDLWLKVSPITGRPRQSRSQARQVLEELLEKYAEHGDAQFVLPDVLKIPPISKHGTINDIVGSFGGPEQLRDAVDQLQKLLYVA